MEGRRVTVLEGFKYGQYGPSPTSVDLGSMGT